MISGNLTTDGGLAGELAALLGVGVPEAQRLLEVFSRAMAADLLASKSVTLAGVGSFLIVYFPSEKKKSEEGFVYTPPRNSLVFQEKPSGSDDTARLAVSRMELSEEEASRFSKAFLSLLGETVKRKQPFRLNGIGSFGLEEDKYTFLPDRTFDELLNREYLNLDQVVLHLQGISGKSKAKMSPVAVSLNILLLVTAISAAVWYYLRPEIPMPTSASEVPAEKSSPKIEAEVSVQERVQPPQPAALKAETHEEPSAVDSLDLVKGDFTIVLGTFRKEETALNESRRLRAGGVSAFVWPAMVNGTKYFRLATGKFSSGTAAAVELKDMPGDLARGACIQKVIKGAVIHGKQQL